MPDSAIAESVADLVLLEGALRTRDFANHLERGALDLASSVGALQHLLVVPHVRLRPYQECLTAAADVGTLVLALRSAAACSSRFETERARVEVAWTYPGLVRPGTRSTAGVARDIVDASVNSLLVVGYSVTVGDSMNGLASQTIDAIARAGQRGAAVTVVLHRKANYDALVSAWRPGVPYPSAFTWPESDDRLASMHAKLLIADRADALVTSANLTYHGFERNIELGVRVRGHAAAEMYDRIFELIAMNELVPWLAKK